MIITIEGKQGEGKTMMSKLITKDRRTFCVDEHTLDTPFWTNGMDTNVEFIIVDEVKDYDKIHSFFNKSKLNISKVYEKPSTIKMPHIILIKMTPR